MRNMIIKSLEVLVWLMMALILIASLLYGFQAMSNPMMGGAMMGIAIIVGGVLYSIIFGGMLFLFIGIYDNTKRMAEMMEKKGA